MHTPSMITQSNFPPKKLSGLLISSLNDAHTYLAWSLYAAVLFSAAAIISGAKSAPRYLPHNGSTISANLPIPQPISSTALFWVRSSLGTMYSRSKRLLVSACSGFCSPFTTADSGFFIDEASAARLL